MKIAANFKEGKQSQYTRADDNNTIYATTDAKRALMKFNMFLNEAMREIDPLQREFFFIEIQISNLAAFASHVT